MLESSHFDTNEYKPYQWQFDESDYCDSHILAFPREFKIEDFPVVIPILNPERLIELSGDVLSDVMNVAVKTINSKFQQSDIEIHRFTMWEGE